MGRIRTINLYNWQLEAIEKLDSNRSNFIREALSDQLECDQQRGLLKIPGMKITTVSMGDILFKESDDLNKAGMYCSMSEYIRLAVRNKILRERMEGKIELFRETLPENMVYIPNMNGGLPFKTRRLD